MSSGFMYLYFRISGFGFIPESKEPLTEVIESGEEAHTDEHCYIGLNLLGASGEQRNRKRFGNPVGEDIAYGDIQYESDHYRKGAFLIFEGEMLVENEAEDTCQDIVCRRGNPEIQVGYSETVTENRNIVGFFRREPAQSRKNQIIKPEHNGCTHKGIYYAYDNKFKELRVKESFDFFNQLHFFRSSSVSRTIYMGLCLVSI